MIILQLKTYYTKTENYNKAYFKAYQEMKPCEPDKEYRYHYNNYYYVLLLLYYYYISQQQQTCFSTETTALSKSKTFLGGVSIHINIQPVQGLKTPVAELKTHRNE